MPFPLIIGLLTKHWRVAGVLLLVLALAWQQVSFTRALGRMAEDNRLLRTELAQARGTIQKLNDTVAAIKPGETRTIYVDRPVYLPGSTSIKEVPVVITRTEKTIETKVSDPIVLPPKEIERIVERSPQSIIFNMEATRDIAKGERFRVIATLIAPGVYQPILEVGSPVTGTVTTVTPVDKIPQPAPEASRWAGRLYVGYSTLDAQIVGARLSYALSKRWDIEGQGECRRFTVSPAGCGSIDGRVTFGARF